METTTQPNSEAFENNLAPMIRRIFGNPGYDTKYSSTDSDTRTISSKWSIAHWRVHTHWRVAHWRVAHWRVVSWTDRNGSAATIESPCATVFEMNGKVILASDVYLRNETFGRLAFKQGDVFALNRAGAEILDKVLETNNIGDNNGEIPTELFQDFISDLLSLGIIELN